MSKKKVRKENDEEIIIRKENKGFSINNIIYFCALEKSFGKCRFKNVNLEYRKQRFRNKIRWEVFDS